MHDNTYQELIFINADRLKLILIEHLENVKNRSAWQAPFGLVITIVLVFCSSDFKTAFGLSADTWRATFLLGGGACLAWLIISLLRIKKSITLDDVIAVVKNKPKSF